ncbi:MAG: zinc ribbon domain-containing protein [Chloroflexi bacterium]|nr:zinc ribbon domain-containing protein [Chloroflexota bacterium]
MPIYEYFCPQCRAEFELSRSFSQAHDPAQCPRCGTFGEKLISVFASKLDYYVKVPEKGPYRQLPTESTASTSPKADAPARPRRRRKTS